MSQNAMPSTDDVTQANVERWRQYYRNLKDSYLLPNEFVVRSFLGTYPNLQMSHDYQGAKVCDAACGDGRNMTLLHRLGMEIYGTEVSQDICDITMSKLQARPDAITADIRPGFHWDLPFEDATFDYMLSWNAIYYMRDAQSDIRDHVREYARVMKPGAYLVACVPTPQCFSLQGAEELGRDLIRINTDSRWDLLNGSIYHRFNSFEAIEQVFGSHFETFRKARISDDCFGLALDYFVFVCQKRA